MGQQAAMNRGAPTVGARRGIGPKETVAMLAALMALNSFAIDAMIPALPEIGAQFRVAQDNDRQLVVIAYMLGRSTT